ncbi:hypothetical protein [Tenacibaculum sp. 190130A14a]|uniref:CdiI immunity protein domain-containing protein n=1 Tax=Tenacibaculum polynesiense TaxID=3137857 RepID=A0ABP1EWK0_9FLAO
MNIFKKRNKVVSLLGDLKKAEKILSEYSGGYSGEHLSAEEFHTDLVDRIKKLENGNENVIEDLRVWFAPTCQWDDFVGDIDLGERIFQQLDRIKNKASR